MKKCFLIIFLAIAFPGVANAYDRNGPCCRNNPKHWYAGFTGSLALLEDVDVHGTTIPSDRHLSFDPGYGIAASLGYDIYPNIAVETEIAYRLNKLDTVDGQPYTSSTPNTYSAQKSTAFMVNGIYTYHNSTSYSPYLGAGGGIVQVKTPIRRTLTGPPDETHDLEDWVPGYQFMGGVRYDIRETPFSVNVGYRYMATETGAVKYSNFPGYEAQFDNTTHNVELGLKMHF